MNRNNVLSTMMKIVYDNKNMRCLLETGERTNTAAIQDDLTAFKLIVGVEKLEEIELLTALQEILENNLILQKQNDLSMLNFEFENVIRYKAVLEDITRFDITFMEYKACQDYIEVDSLCKIHIDKEGILIGNSTITDVKYRQLKPTNREFTTCCNEFFIAALKVAKGLFRGQIVYAMNIFDEVRIRLQEMTSYYIGSNYDFRVNIGSNFEYLKTYLDKEHYSKLLETYPSPDRDKMWTQLFNACMLFRKEGLAVAEILDYEYPKIADREIVRYLRDAWNMYTS